MYNSVNRVVVKVSNICIGLKKRLVWGVLEQKEIRDKDNATMKEEGGIEMSNYSAPFTITKITIQYSDTINTLKLEKNILTIITIMHAPYIRDARSLSLLNYLPSCYE